MMPMSENDLGLNPINENLHLQPVMAGSQKDLVLMTKTKATSFVAMVVEKITHTTPTIAKFVANVIVVVIMQIIAPEKALWNHPQAPA